MAFIELQNIGKIYASEGAVAVGIRGVNLSFEKGEFVAVTGQSGSGKSTLLNIISGMDTYEEGEMLIEGEPTSHYIQEDYEQYRKKYISFIFQDYNIIESFTVLQNVELSLMHIENRKERRQKALELLKRVGMESHLRHRGSQLSGGQKQRTVIARALAKDSPVILADEPTGNLDSKTSKEILELLHEVSKDKLVIVVTHNFDDVQPYATRHIRVFDSKIEFDRGLVQTVPFFEHSKPAKTEVSKKVGSLKQLLSTVKGGTELGRVRFFAMPKLSIFICILMIFSCLAVTLVTSLYGQALDDLNLKTYMFTPYKGRLVLSKQSGSFSTEALEKLKTQTGALYYEGCDILRDAGAAQNVIFTCDDKGTPDIGRYPEKESEVLLALPIHMQETYGKKELLVSSYTLFKTVEYEISGIVYYVDNTKTPSVVFSKEGYELASSLALWAYASSCSSTLTVSSGESKLQIPFAGQNVCLSFELSDNEFTCVSKELDTAVKKLEGGSTPIKFSLDTLATVTGLSFDEYGYPDTPPDAPSFTVSTADISRSGKAELYLQNLMMLYGYENCICISPKIIDSLMKDNYIKNHYPQASLYFSSDERAENAMQTARNEGYNCALSSTVIQPDAEEQLLFMVLNVISLFVWFSAIVFIALFMYLVSSKAMQATSSDIAVLRTMGIPVKVIKFSIYIQTMIALIPAFIFTAVTLVFIFNTPLTNAVFTYLHADRYALIAVGVILASIFVSRRYIKKIFQSTVKKTLKGGGLK